MFNNKNFKAIAFPIPLEPPVTTATLPFNNTSHLFQ